MFHRLTKEAYFQKIIASTNYDGTPFYFLPKQFHDPTLTFETRLYQYITENASALALTGKKWIGIIWRRSVVGDSPHQTQYKRQNFVLYNGNANAPEYQCYKWRFSAVQMEIAFYSNDVDYLEDFEFNVFLDIPINFSLPVLYPAIHPTVKMSNLITNHVHKSITKETRENFGTLAKLETSCLFNIVVPKFEGNIKGVKDIVFDISSILHSNMPEITLHYTK